MSKIDTGDTIRHKPTDEQWLVGVVKGGKLYPLGYPPCAANLEDCELIKKATPKDRLMWLRDQAKNKNSSWREDDRYRIANEILRSEASIQPEAVKQ